MGLYGTVTRVAAGEVYVTPDGHTEEGGIGYVTLRTQDFHEAGSCPLPGLRVKVKRVDPSDRPPIRYRLVGIQTLTWLEV